MFEVDNVRHTSTGQSYQMLKKSCGQRLNKVCDDTSNYS